MNIPEIYDYLCRARRDLWAVLEQTPDEILSKPILEGEKLRLKCIKDFVFHIPMIEDDWVHADLLRDTLVCDAFPWVDPVRGDGPVYAQTPLSLLLEYWRAVEESTLKFLPTLTAQELSRQVALGGPNGTESTALDGLMWHVLVHEMRHTAQLALLLRMQGVAPPHLDVIAYLPTRPVHR